MKRATGVLTAVAIGIGAAVFAQSNQRGATTTAVPPGDWHNINRDSGATRFSPLTQINAGNVGKLTQAWTFPGVGGSSVPVVVNGVVYLSAGRRVVAVDADSGRQVWEYTVTPPGAPPAPPTPAAPPASAAAAPAPPAPAAPPAQAGAAPAQGDGRRGGGPGGGGRAGGGPGGGGGGRGGGRGGGPTASQRGLSYWPG